MSKTKKIEKKVKHNEWRYNREDMVLLIDLTKEEHIQFCNRNNDTLLLSFEIPLEEPSVSITPSMIDELCVEYNSESGPTIYWRDFIKSKLFPDWKDE